MSDTLSALLRSLQQVGLDVDAEAALDAVWLGVQMRAKMRNTEATGTDTARALAERASVLGANAAEAAEILDVGAPNERRLRRTGEFAIPAAAQVPSTTARTLTLPRAAALPNRRDLIKALRPLRRRVVSPGSGVLDIETTVRRAAEEDLLIPSFQPARERWLDVLLVVDHGLSMIIWKDTIDEFERVLRSSGAFRSVRSWWVESDAKQLAVTARGRGQSPSGPERLMRLVRGVSRSVVLVVSDCVGARWHDGAIPRLMSRWSDAAPLALMQVTPEWFWARTALGDTVGSRFRSPIAAAINRQLNWDATALGALAASSDAEKQLFRVPAATLTSDAVARIANLVAGVGREWARGVVFDLTWERDAEVAPAASADERIGRFLALASKNAKRLAAAYAASPVRTLGVLRLLRRDLLPDASPFIEAEVLLGGIVRVRRYDARWDLGASLPLEFHPGVQALLLDGALSGDVVRVLTHAASVAASGVGETFTSWLEDPSSGAAQLDPAASTFAAGAAEALLRLGGAYARIVRPRPAGVHGSGSIDISGSSPEATTEAAATPEGSSQETGDVIVTIEYLVSGRLAGVGFRFFVEQCARELGIEGSAQNLRDGRIRVEATGPRRALNELEARLRKGLQSAQVSDVTAHVITPKPEREPDVAPSPSPSVSPPPPPSPNAPPRERMHLWELAFDENGKIEGAGVASIGAALHVNGIRDLVVLVHGWNVDRAGARSLYFNFVDTIYRVHGPAIFPAIGALGVFWPSKLWPDEDEEGPPADELETGLKDLEERTQIEDASLTLQKNPDDPEALERLNGLLRDAEHRGTSRSAATESKSSESSPGFFGGVWRAAKDLVRATTFYQMRKRAGTVGDLGLGPLLGQFATMEPEVRIHLVAHSVGARVVARALAVMLDHYANTPVTVKSLTILQGIMSHNAFAIEPSEGTSAPGALADVVRRVDGPIVVTFSRNDQVARVAYPLMARLVGGDGDAPGERGPGRGALAIDGAQGVVATTLEIGRVGTDYQFERPGFYNVDASEFVSSHADVFGPEIAWLVLAAARLRPFSVSP